MALATLEEPVEPRDFAALFGWYVPRLVAFYRRRGVTASVAEELSQDVMLAVWNRRDLFDARLGTLSGWIFRIARNRLIDASRRQRREPDPHDPAWVDAERRDDEPSPESEAARRGTRRRLSQALQRLPEADRSLLEALYIEGKSMSQFAEQTRTPLGTVKTRARRIARELRVLLTEDAHGATS